MTVTTEDAESQEALPNTKFEAPKENLRHLNQPIFLYSSFMRIARDITKVTIFLRSICGISDFWR